MRCLRPSLPQVLLKGTQLDSAIVRWCEVSVLSGSMSVRGRRVGSGDESLAMLLNRDRQLGLGFEVDARALTAGVNAVVVLTVKYSPCGCVVTPPTVTHVDDRASITPQPALLHEFTSSFTIPM